MRQWDNGTIRQWDNEPMGLSDNGKSDNGAVRQWGNGAMRQCSGCSKMFKLRLGLGQGFRAHARIPLFGAF
jgi:hypothetical protein